MLGEIEAEAANSVVLADMEAGLGTMTRMKEGHVDYVLVVIEPSWKALEVGQRAVSLARESGVGQVFVVANRVGNGEQLAMVREAFPAEEILVVPEDDSIRLADLHGQAPIDAAPNSPGILALTAVANRLINGNAH